LTLSVVAALAYLRIDPIERFALPPETAALPPELLPELPIDAVLPALRAAIAARGMAVLQAPPGAGKTTRVPLDLLASGLIRGRIIMLEPRRLAARAAAERMAETLGQPVGASVGYRIRGEARVSAATRIEVVTEGILTRMIQSDPGLEGIGAVVFDEFHERSLNADLGLALSLEQVGDGQQAVPVITSSGRAYPVETRWLPRPVDASMRFEAALAALVAEAEAESRVIGGGILVFLPGEGEIRRVEAALAGRLPGECEIRPLFGAMDFAAQRQALAPLAAPRRKVVLATSIAETSLTIPDIRVVVDGGRARRARFDPNSGMSRLVTERVTRAEAEQRRGRAGRVAEGLCYRLWTRGEEGGLAAFPPAEIEAADLTGLALELALWGGDQGLGFLTPPPVGPMAEARALLVALGALDAHGQITAHGRRLAALPLHPRLGHMLVVAGRGAADLAALISARDPLRGAGPDLGLRLAALRDPRRFEGQLHRPTLEQIREEGRRLARLAGPALHGGLSPAQMAALAYPDRIGLRRRGDAPRWLLSGGRGAALAATGAASGEISTARLIVATDLEGGREAQLRLALPISEAELRAVHGDAIHWRNLAEWSRRDGRVIARRQEVFGALVLDDRPWPAAPEDQLAQAALAGLRQIGLPWKPAARRLRARIALARSADWPEVSDQALLARGEDWLLPYLGKARSEADLCALDLCVPLRALIGWERLAELERLAPAHFTTPLGREVPIDYEGEAPSIALRLQEMFGVTRHPLVGQQRLPLRITLLSPAQRPVQVTMDLPGFWASSYADVRKEMRGQYPKHPWPEDPTLAEPTLRARPRGRPGG
jgi:ATP-dependent helicase HrpB